MYIYRMLDFQQRDEQMQYNIPFHDLFETIGADSTFADDDSNIISFIETVWLDERIKTI